MRLFVDACLDRLVIWFRSVFTFSFVAGWGVFRVVGVLGWFVVWVWVDWRCFA